MREDWDRGVMPRDVEQIPDYVEKIVHRDFMHGLSYRHVPVAANMTCTHRTVRKQQTQVCGLRQGRRARHHGRAPRRQRGRSGTLSLYDGGGDNEDQDDDSVSRLSTPTPSPYLGQDAQYDSRPADGYYQYHDQVERFKTELKLALMALVRE